VTRAAGLIKRIEEATTGLDSEEDRLRAALELEDTLSEDERGFCEWVGLRVLAAISNHGRDAP
jgi:hypothetical protein